MHRCCQMNKDLTSQQSICLDYSNIVRPKTTVFVTTKARLMHVAIAATIGGRFTMVCMVAGMVGILFGLSSNLSYNFCTGPWRLAEYRKKKGLNSYIQTTLVEIDYICLRVCIGRTLLLFIMKTNIFPPYVNQLDRHCFFTLNTIS